MPHNTSLDSDITDALWVLCRGCEGIETVMNTNPDSNRFSLALTDLQLLSHENNIPIAIVGGLAAIRYGYPAATQDIDVVIGQGDLSRLIMIAPAYRFKVAWESKLGWHTLTHGDVEINIVPEGGMARDSSPTTIPGPAKMGVPAGLHYANIESWIELKISSGRVKDRAHVVEVLKKTSPEIIRQIEVHLSKTDPSYLAEFKLLRAESIAEDRQERDRR